MTTVDAVDALDEELFGTPPSRRSRRVTAVLAAGVLAVVAFSGGAFVQREWGAESLGAAAMPGGGAMPAGFGGMRGAGGAAGGAAPDGAAAGGTAAGSAAAAGGMGAASSTAPAVVGTVVSVSGTTLTVKNFGGETVTVTVPEGTAVTSQTAVDLGSLAAGTAVSVAGTSADGKVTASSVTAR